MERMDYMLRVRIPTSEETRLQNLAALMGCTVSELVRHLIADARVVVRSPLVEVDEVPNQSRAVLTDMNAALV